MVGDINERRLEFHQRINVGENLLGALSLKWRQNFKSEFTPLGSR
jgi:hypothetical protein